MRLIRKSGFAGLALIASLSVSLQPIMAQEAVTTVQSPVDPLQIGSFSGAFLAARTAEQDQDYDSATLYYRRALTLDPGNQQIERSLFVGLLAKGDFPQSLRYAEKLKLVRDVSRLATLAMGVDSLRKKDFKQAEKLFATSNETDLDGLIDGLLVAWSKQGKGDTKGALATLDAMKGPPWYSLFVGYHRALIAEMGGDKAEARKSFNEVMENKDAGSAAPETYLRLAEAYAGFLARSGDRKAALEVLNTADAFVPGRPPITNLRERIEGNQPVAPMFVSPVAGSAEVLLNLATALNQSGSESYVRLYLQLARALNPANDMILLQLAGIAEQQQRPNEAIALYSKISNRSSLKRAAELQIGLNLADLDRNAEAIDHLKLALEHDSDDLRAYLALGGVYTADKKFAEAAAIYDRAVALIAAPKRSNWMVFYQRGIAYERLKEWDKAEPNFKKALELFPDQPQVLNYLGYSWVDMSINLQDGLNMIKKAVELRPSDGYIVDSLGWAYYRLGQFDDAVRELERAVSLLPGDPVLNDHLGDAYWRVGRKLEATFQWHHAIDREPEPAELVKIQQKLKIGLPDLPDPAAASADPAPKRPEPVKAVDKKG